MFSPTVLRQAEENLDDVLRIIDDECYARPRCALFEPERSNFVEEEQSLRQRLQEINDSASTSSIYSLRRLVGLPPVQAQKCLGETERLRKRIRDTINENRRNILTGRISPFDLPSNSMSPGIGNGRLPVDDNSERGNEMVTSPLNMRCSVSEPPELNVDDTSQDGSDFRFDMNEAMSTPLRRASDRMSDFYYNVSRERRSPIMRVTGSGISEVSESPRRSHSFRGSPVPSLQSSRQSRAYSPRSPGSEGVGANEDYTSQSKTNCVEIRDSRVDGLTLNNGGTNNSGSVIHKMIPQRIPQAVS